MEELVRLQDFESNRDIVLLVEQQLRREVLDLRVQQAKRIVVCDVQGVQNVDRQFLVRLPHLLRPVGVRAVLSELADSVLLVVLAFLSLEVVVRDVEHFVFYLQGQDLNR